MYHIEDCRLDKDRHRVKFMKYKLLKTLICAYFLFPFAVKAGSCNERLFVQLESSVSGIELTAYTHQILVTWKDIRAANKYGIRYSKASNMDGSINKEIGFIRYVINGVDKATDYYIQVRAMENEKWTNWSHIIHSKTALFSTTVETYNILSSQYDSIFPNNIWEERKVAMRNIIMDSQNYPDILGIQEGMKKSQVMDLVSLLKSSYNAHVSQRNVSARAIFWKPEKYSLISFDDDMEAFDSTVSGHATLRYVTFVRLKERKTNKEILIFNIHAPSSFGGDMQSDRANLATTISRKAKELSKAAGNAPVILLGDFNSAPKPVNDLTQTPAMILTNNKFYDSYNLTNEKRNAYYGTHDRITSGVATSGRNSTNCSKRIDYIFIYPMNVTTVSDYHVYINFENDSGAILKRPIPSDHRPVRATLHFHY